MDQFITALENFDYNLFRMVNSMHTEFFDTVMWWLSNRFIWIPLYLLLLYLMYRNYGILGALVCLVGVVFAIGIVDSTCTYIIKENVARYRPSHNLEFSHMVHTVNGYRGGQYGFVSSHAANSFVIAIFAGRVLRKRFPVVLPLLILWALLIAYSRVYLGVHYPSDVVAGGLFGGFIGYLISLVYNRRILKRFAK